MDTINLLFLRHGKANVAMQRLNVDVERWRANAYSLRLQRDFYKKADSTKLVIIKNKDAEIGILQELRIIDSLSKKEPSGFKNYIISFLLGAAAAIAAVLAL